MPAAERELIFALFEVASKSSIANVLLVVPVHSDESSSLVAQLQEKEVKVSVVVSLKGLQNAPRGAYDAIIANKLIVTDQVCSFSRFVLLCMIVTVLIYVPEMECGRP
ncbi:hypothetical protein Tcan_13595 [Toxocara canis]|uniref:Uncharacterized protein n=1 Tax=Toxocara canis TaxID=6265 RepID=A0A0B2W1E8_TOXCA|nr:hypothetical protein Tcan_13595 [Toxocara canis]